VFEVLDWHLTHQPSERLRFYALEAVIALADRDGDCVRRWVRRPPTRRAH